MRKMVIGSSSHHTSGFRSSVQCGTVRHACNAVVRRLPAGLLRTRLRQLLADGRSRHQLIQEGHNSLGSGGEDSGWQGRQGEMSRVNGKACGHLP